MSDRRDPLDQQTLRELFAAAIEIEEPERSRFLDAHCGSSESLRRAVEQLIEADLAAESREFWRVPALEIEARVVAEDETAEQRPAPLERLGPYRILSPIGSGGMGVVYLAEREFEDFRQLAAIKMIPRILADPENVRRFRQERQILARLLHPNIARLLDAGCTEEGIPYLVLEYVDGTPIDRYVAEHNLSIGERVALFRKVCDAVSFAHRNLVVHRDLKPANILVDHAGNPKLLDFGIARLLGEVSDPQATSAALMTPRYASPEQLSGGPVTTASDIYSLGAILHELITGEDFDEPRKRLGGDLEAVVAMSLRSEPECRYATASDLAEDVQRAVDRRPVRARRGTFRYRASRFLMRNRFAMAAAVVVAIAMISAVAAIVVYGRRAEHRFEQLRALTHSALFEFQDSIADLPGATKARALLVRRALEYLNELSSDSIDDPAVLSDLAEAYTRIAQIQGGERNARLGGSARDSLGNLLKALAISRRLAERDPASSKRQDQLAAAIWSAADGYSTVGDLEKSLDLHRERLRIEEKRYASGGRIEDLYYLITSVNSVAEMERLLGDGAASLEDNRRGLRLTAIAIERDSDPVRAHRKAAISHEYTGYTLGSLERFAEAAEEHRAAAAELQPLVQAATRNVGLQRVLAVAEENECESLARAGFGERAQPHCRTAIGIDEALMLADSADVQAQEDLASAKATLALAVHRTGDPARALMLERTAGGLFENALAKDPDSLDLEEEYAGSLLETAAIYLRLDRTAEATASAVQAKAKLDQLITVSPRNREYRRCLLRAEELLSSLNQQSSNLMEPRVQVDR